MNDRPIQDPNGQTTEEPFHKSYLNTYDKNIINRHHTDSQEAYMEKDEGPLTSKCIAIGADRC